MNCDNTFRDYISNSQDTIEVNAKLEPVTEYKVIISDKFQHQYKSLNTTDSDGYFQLLTSEFPAGLFNLYAGDFSLEVFLPDDDCQKQNFDVFDGDKTRQYDSIVFSVVGGNRDKSNLGCKEVGVYG